MCYSFPGGTSFASMKATGWKASSHTPIDVAYETGCAGNQSKLLWAVQYWKIGLPCREGTSSPCFSHAFRTEILSLME